MKKILFKFKTLLFAVLLFTCASAFAQDYTAVDAKVNQYTSLSNPEKLAARINQDFTKEDEKARAIFTWIARNVRYDMATYNSNLGQRQIAFTYTTPEEKIRKQRQYNLDMANKTFRSKTGVCQGYSALYNRLAELTGLESITIPGTSKSHPTHIGKLPIAADHAWNAVKTDGKWKLIDVTWAAGGVDSRTRKFLPKFNDSYFFTDPEVFFLNHFPDDERLLMINRSPEDFARLPLYYGEYLQSNYEIVSPETGIFNNSTVIPFRIKNLDTDKIAYVLSSDNKVRTIVPKRKGTISEFEIVLDKRTSGYLTLYIGHSSIVTYKIQRG